MTHTHGGFTDAQIQAVAGGGPSSGEGVQISGQQGFDEFASTLPESAEGFRAGGPSQTGAAPSTAPAPVPPDPQVEARRVMSRKITAQMNKIKKLFSEGLPTIAFNKLTEGREGDWTLTEKESEAISETFDMVFDAAGVEFQIEPWNVILKSKLWLLALPVAVCAIIFGSKFIKNAKPLTAESTETSEPVRTDAQ